ncbi:MAG: tetratricopeptide repeat protein [Planctomycetota bacterium]
MKARGLAALLLVLVLSGAASAGELDDIRKLFERRMFRTGVPRLESHLAANPDSHEALGMLGELRYADEAWEEAEEAALSAIRLAPSIADYRHLWARARFQRGRQAAQDGETPATVAAFFAKAEQVFLQVQQIDAQHPDVLWWIGWAKEWQRQQSVARQFYDSQIREFPRYAPGYVRLAQSLVDTAARDERPKKRRREALGVFDQGLERAGEDAELLYHRALLLATLGEKEKAVESLRRSIRADPGFDRAWNRLRMMVDEEKVLVPLAISVLEKDPACGPAARWAGFFTSRRDPLDDEKPWTKYELTIKYTLRALEVYSDDEELYKLAFRSAQELIGANPKQALNATVAIDTFSRVHAAWKWDGDAANNLGFYFREVGRYSESLAWYLKGVERAPTNQDILNDCGLMFLFHFPKQKEQGLPYFEKTVALVAEGDQKPIRGYWDALENLCKHYWEVDRQPEKVVEYARLRYLVTKGVKPYNMSKVAERFAEKARKALAK